LCFQILSLIGKRRRCTKYIFHLCVFDRFLSEIPQCFANQKIILCMISDSHSGRPNLKDRGRSEIILWLVATYDVRFLEPHEKTYFVCFSEREFAFITRLQQSRAVSVWSPIGHGSRTRVYSALLVCLSNTEVRHFYALSLCYGGTKLARSASECCQ
jgi:hypothetical protein